MIVTDLALAVDLGGTKVETALVEASGAIVDGSRHRVPTGRDAEPDAFAEALSHAIRQTLALTPADSTLIGVGVGSAGPIDLARGRVSPKNLPALAGFNLRDAVSRELPGLAVQLRLDGTCIALAEHWLGAAAGSANSMSMVVSTGVGGGLILGGKLVSGRSGNAGHIGQIHVAGFGAESSSADATTLEASASGTSAVGWAQRLGWPGRSGEDLAVSCAAGDDIAWRAVRRSAAAVGQAIASATTLLDLEIVAIGGGFSLVVPDYIDLVRTAALEATVFEYATTVRIEPARLGADAPLLGAAALIHRSAMAATDSPISHLVTIS
ncbi:ROK family protein [Curtobacterium sp. MCLR17_007]|uniref:ROK family protein n=1 Tax=Curtobacterium sp. MCLR17_007 TaxID=2175648 RepID=UPI000DAA8F22|nr:ROK family protein [Curtobacterium sp. MCLR17_007]WIB60443.1 ROK family protein [Curtobacterium sp. MCLR17_007]